MPSESIRHPPANELGRTRGTNRLRWRGSKLDNIEELSAREKWSAAEAFITVSDPNHSTGHAEGTRVQTGVRKRGQQSR